MSAEQDRYDIIVIGGGASGLMFTASLSVKDRKGLLIEKTGSFGSKLLMSGGGRCNITHGGMIRDFISAYGESGPALRKCLYRHSNIELAGWLAERGISLADEKGRLVDVSELKDAGRVFPASMKASDILNLFLEELAANGWEMKTETDVYNLQAPETAGSPWKVMTSRGCLLADHVVAAAGGITFPETGSDGSLLNIVRGLQIDVTEPRSALAPVYVRDYPYQELSGISIEDVVVTAFSTDAACTCKGKASRMRGDLLFTHRGFSGPVILNISGYAEPGEILRIQYGRELSELPKRMQKALEDRAKGPSGDIRSKTLAALLDHDDFTVISADKNGMVTRGGISLDEVDLSSMQISRFPGLYAIGEIIDADGITGGYNLQLCWSTARTAADALS